MKASLFKHLQKKLEFQGQGINLSRLVFRSLTIWSTLDCISAAEIALSSGKPILSIRSSKNRDSRSEVKLPAPFTAVTEVFSGPHLSLLSQSYS